MKIVIKILILLTIISACKKEKQSNKDLDIPNPMTDKKGWNLVKYSPEFYYLKSFFPIPITLDLVKEHADGIDIMYNSVYELDGKSVNVRWRAFHNKENDVNKVQVVGIARLDGQTPIMSTLVSSYSRGMGDNDLFAITQIDKRVPNGSPSYEYDYFSVKILKNTLNSTWFKFLSTQTDEGVASANPQQPFVCNGMNARVFNNPKNIYAMGDFLSVIAAAPKGNQLVMLAIADTLLYVLESSKSVYYHSSGNYGEEVNAVTIKNVFNLNQLTGQKSQNFIDVSKCFFNDQNLYVFLGMRHQKHRLLKIDLNNYTLKSENESLYEKMDLTPGFKNIIMLDDRPGEMLSMEKDGIYHLAGNSKTFIPSPSIKVGSTGTSVYYSAGKVWQVLFDEKGAYLINRKL
jgi:hypothetical protein